MPGGNTPTYQDISSPKLVWNTMLPKRNFMDNKMIEDMLTSSEHVKLPVLSDQVMKNLIYNSVHSRVLIICCSAW